MTDPSPLVARGDGRVSEHWFPTGSEDPFASCLPEGRESVDY